MRTQGTVDDWYAEQQAFPDALAALRAIVLEAGLTETLKWRQPCYQDAGKNVLIVSVRKDCAVVSFLKGALLADPDGVLVQPGENSRSARYLRFESLEHVVRDKARLQGFIAAAVKAERAGARVKPPSAQIDYVEELKSRMARDEAFRVAFEALTPGRRRAYNLHFGQPKNSDTRSARIQRCEERILAGKGLLDCVCGHTKRPPGCDGSHKYHR